MEITEVRVKLVGNDSDRLKAFCSITLDADFVVRDLKIIDGVSGELVAYLLHISRCYSNTRCSLVLLLDRAVHLRHHGVGLGHRINDSTEILHLFTGRLPQGVHLIGLIQRPNKSVDNISYPKIGDIDCHRSRQYRERGEYDEQICKPMTKIH